MSYFLQETMHVAATMAMAVAVAAMMVEAGALLR